MGRREGLGRGRGGGVREGGMEDCMEGGGVVSRSQTTFVWLRETRRYEMEWCRKGEGLGFGGGMRGEERLARMEICLNSLPTKSLRHIARTGASTILQRGREREREREGGRERERKGEREGAHRDSEMQLSLSTSCRACYHHLIIAGRACTH